MTGDLRRGDRVIAYGTIRNLGRFALDDAPAVTIAWDDDHGATVTTIPAEAVELAPFVDPGCCDNCGARFDHDVDDDAQHGGDRDTGKGYLEAFPELCGACVREARW